MCYLSWRSGRTVPVLFDDLRFGPRRAACPARPARWAAVARIGLHLLIMAFAGLVSFEVPMIGVPLLICFEPGAVFVVTAPPVRIIAPWNLPGPFSNTAS